MNDSDTKKSKRRLYRFSLRSLFVFMVVSSVGLGWLGWKLQQARSQRAAVAKLQQLGARITFDNQGHARAVEFPDSDIPDTDVPSSTVELAPTRDAELVHLKTLPKLEELNLRQVHITDAGLEKLRELNNLRVLNLHAGFGGQVIFPDITDNGLKHLETLTNLEYLDLADSPITDDGLKHLSRLTHLRKLDIQNSRVASYNAIRVIEDGLLVLKPIDGLPPGGTYQMGELTCLEQVTEAGLMHLSAMTKLESLNLRGLQVHNAGLVHLKGMSELKELNLSNTPVVDAGLVHRGFKSGALSFAVAASMRLAP